MPNRSCRRRLLLILGCLVCTLFQPGLGQAAQKATVTINTEPEVKGAEILLGDVAVILGDAGLVGSLQELKIGRAALPGQERAVSVSTLRVRMRQAGLPTDRVIIEAPASSFSVYTVAAWIQPEMLRDAVHTVLRDERERLYDLQGDDDFELVCGNLPEPVPVPWGDPAAQVTRFVGTPSGQVAVPVELSVDGKPFRTVMVRCEVRTYQQVLVTTEPLSRHEVLTPDKVEVAVRETAGLARRLVQPENAAVQELRATRPLQPGTVLTSNMVELRPAVQRGERVELVVELGSVRAVVLGLALADGRIGDLIPVENLSSGQTLQGRLGENETVYVMQKR